MPNESYRTLFKTYNDGQSCNIVVVDSKNLKVPVQSPEYSCTKTFKGILKNGTSYQHFPKIYY